MREYKKKSISNIERLAIEKFCAVVKQSIDQYYFFLSQEQEQSKGRYAKLNLSHGNRGASNVSEIWAYISHKDADFFNETVGRVIQATLNNCGRKARDHSFITLLAKHLYAAYPLINLDEPTWNDTESIKN